MVVLETEELVNAVLLASRREETEWSLLLPFTKTLIARFPAAEGQLLKSIGEQIKEAVTSLDVSAILRKFSSFFLFFSFLFLTFHIFPAWFKIVKILLPTEEKIDTLLSYSSWFQNTFVDPTGLCPTKKEQRFILRVLTQMVPDDSVSLLKVDYLIWSNPSFFPSFLFFCPNLNAIDTCKNGNEDEQSPEINSYRLHGFG
jgi:hypothetical protein